MRLSHLSLAKKLATIFTTASWMTIAVEVWLSVAFDTRNCGNLAHEATSRADRSFRCAGLRNLRLYWRVVRAEGCCPAFGIEKKPDESGKDFLNRLGAKIGNFFAER